MPRGGWLGLGIVAVLVVVIVAVRRSSAGRKGKLSPLSGLVVDTFSNEWAAKLGTTPEEVRRAVAEPSADGILNEQLRSMVRTVDATFTRNRDGRSITDVSITCSYSEAAAVTTATLRLPWDQVPSDVREEFLRGGQDVVVRQMGPADLAPA